MNINNIFIKIKLALPFLVLTLFIIVIWTVACSTFHVPPYILPSPQNILDSLFENVNILFSALFYTIKITLLSFFISAAIGLIFALFITQLRWFGSAVMPYIVAIQVTPFVAIAPLLQIWSKNISTAVIILAIIASIFPIINNAVLGMKSVDEGLHILFSTYQSTKIQRIRYLLIPGSLPSIIAGLKIGLTLALIGTVVGQFLLANSSQNGGISYIMMQSEYNLQTAQMFAALLLLILSGIIFFLLAGKIGKYFIKHWNSSES